MSGYSHSPPVLVVAVLLRPKLEQQHSKEYLETVGLHATPHVSTSNSSRDHSGKNDWEQANRSIEDKGIAVVALVAAVVQDAGVRE